MKKPVLILIAAVTVAGCATDRFAMIDQKSGAELGPFLYRSGSYVTVGDKTYKIKRLVSLDEHLLDRMKSEIIPEIDFREAHIQDVADLLSDMCVEMSPAKPMLRIHLLVPNKGDDVPRVTFHARSLSLHNVLSSIAKLADLDFVVEEGNVWLKYKEN